MDEREREEEEDWKVAVDPNEEQETVRPNFLVKALAEPSFFFCIW